MSPEPLWTEPDTPRPAAADPPSGAGQRRDRRALCAWLGGLASHRAGLIGKLLESFPSLDALLAHGPAELAAFPALRQRTWCPQETPDDRPRREPRTTSGSTGAGHTHADAEETSSAFAAILAQSPARYLAQLEGRGEGYAVVTWIDPLYPPGLRHLADPPLCLFIRARCGRRELRARLAALTDRPAVAVVGTRTPSTYGEDMASLLGRDLARRGVLVVSGLAMGIDALAQAAAVTADPGLTPTTVSVLGCGADVIYPKANARLRDEIAHSGLLVSEFAWGVPARAWRFPARNRVMAALVQAVVVVEGSERSGARITANFALDLGREILAVPGEAGKRLSAAPHALLRQGAALCESADDVLAALSPFAGAAAPSDTRRQFQSLPGLPAPLRSVLDALGEASQSADQLARQCGLSAGAVGAALSELEIDGLVRPLGGGRYRLVRH